MNDVYTRPIFLGAKMSAWNRIQVNSVSLFLIAEPLLQLLLDVIYGRTLTIQYVHTLLRRPNNKFSHTKEDEGIKVSFQDQTDNYCLLNSLLNFDETPVKDSVAVTENLNENDNMEWLDLVDYKEEPNYEEDRNSPEKESERKRKHNQSMLIEIFNEVLLLI